MAILTLRDIKIWNGQETAGTGANIAGKQLVAFCSGVGCYIASVAALIMRKRSLKPVVDMAWSTSFDKDIRYNFV